MECSLFYWYTLDTGDISTIVDRAARPAKGCTPVSIS
jgi:hypothetical protein